MKIEKSQRSRRAAFTLVELIVVIGIIALLAAMIFPAFAGVKKKAAIRKARTELQQLEVAINSYKTRHGFLPPGNQLANFSASGRKFFALNPLYFELKGTKLSTNSSYQSLDGKISIAPPDVQTAFGGGVAGFMNCTRGNGDEAAPAQDFFKDLKPGQYVFGTFSGKSVAILSCSVQWSKDLPPVMDGFVPDDLSVYPNPWRYTLNGTNNPGGYDLWVDIVQSGKTNRISNWSNKPEIVFDP